MSILYFTETLCGPHEKRLLNDLLDPYNTLERPVANESEPLQLSFGLMLMQIIDVVSNVFNAKITPVNNLPSSKRRICGPISFHRVIFKYRNKTVNKSMCN